MSQPTITVYNELAPIADIWADIDRDTIQSPSTGHTFYQTLPWNRFVDSLYRRSLPFRLGIKRIDYLTVSIDDHTAAILPLLVSTIEKKIEFISWKTAGCNNMTCAHESDNIADSAAKALIEHIATAYRGYRLRLFDMPVESSLAKALCDTFPTIKVMPRSSFHIPLGNFASYDDYFKSLSSHQRQNLRTLYNHVAKNNTRVELKMFDRDNLPDDSYMRRVWDLYFMRKAIWRNKRQGIANSIVRRVEIAREMSGEKTESLRALTEARLFAVEVDGNLAAFLLMYLDSHSNAVIPKLAIHPDYQRQSPGNLLLVETLKWCFGNNVCDFDLSRGDEVYKRRFGGVEEQIARYSLPRIG